MDKLFYVVTRPAGASLQDFSSALRGDVAAAMAKELPTGTRIRVRLRDDAGTAFDTGPWAALVPTPERVAPRRVAARQASQPQLLYSTSKSEIYVGEKHDRDSAGRSDFGSR